MWLEAVGRGQFCGLVLEYLISAGGPSLHFLFNPNLHYSLWLSIHLLGTVLCLVSQSCLTLCHPMDCSPPGSSVHGDSPGKKTGEGCHAFLQGIFPIQDQGSNPGLLLCRWILNCLSHQGSPRILEGMDSLSLLQGIFPTQQSNPSLLHFR